MEKETVSKIIVDLYEMRVSTFHKYSSKDDLIMDNHKYNFFTSAIAQLCSKYGITDRDIEEELHKRKVNNLQANEPPIAQ